MERDILDALVDLHKQATVERSHFYVASVANRARFEIEKLRRAIDKAESALAAARR